MIITTLLDTDLYKFTTSYAYIKLFPYAIGTFSFKDRDNTVYNEAFLAAVKEEIVRLSEIALRQEELEYMVKNCRFLPQLYWEWLSSFRFDPEKIDVSLDSDGHLHIEITDYMYKATLYEVPILAIVSETKNQFYGHKADLDLVISRLDEKIERYEVAVRTGRLPSEGCEE